MAPYENSLWYVETNLHPLLEIAKKQPDMVNYIRPSFWSRFVELQRVMWETNSALTARHAYDSRPMSWPVLRRGINYWTKDHRQIYLLGNPFIWYGSLCAIMVYVGARALLMLRAKRGHKDYNDSMIQYYDQTAGFLTLAWAMHFFPFFAMHRQLFLHHYLPALYFSILLFAVLFDALTSGLRPRYRFIAAMLMIAIAFMSYATYAPITYATPWTKQACERARLSKAWDLNCQDFPENVRMYNQYGPGIHTVDSNFANNSILNGNSETTGLAVGFEPQAGNHPFEQAPKQAAVSNSASLDDVRIPVASYGSNQDQAQQQQQQAVPAMPAPPAPVHIPPPAGDGKEKDGAKGDNAKDGEPQSDDPGQKQHADIKGLDQEGVEAVVLEGTADRADVHVPAQTLTNGVTGINEAPASLETEIAVEDVVQIKADI